MRVFGVRDFLREQVVHYSGPHHEQQESPIPPAVKEIAGDQKKAVLRVMAEAPINPDGEG